VPSRRRGEYIDVIVLTVLGALMASASAAALFAMWRDKRAAERGSWRWPESTLHLLELAGGWPGSLVGQRLLRHKTRKLSYQILFWLCVVTNVAMVTAAIWLWRRAP